MYALVLREALGIALHAVDVAAEAEDVLTELLESVVHVAPYIALVRPARIVKKGGIDVESDYTAAPCDTLCHIEREVARAMAYIAKIGVSGDNGICGTLRHLVEGLIREVRDVDDYAVGREYIHHKPALLGKAEILSVPGRGRQLVGIPAKAHNPEAHAVERVDLTGVGHKSSAALDSEDGRAHAVLNRVVELLAIPDGEYTEPLALRDIYVEEREDLLPPDLGRHTVLRYKLGKELQLRIFPRQIVRVDQSAVGIDRKQTVTVSIHNIHNLLQYR